MQKLPQKPITPRLNTVGVGVNETASDSAVERATISTARAVKMQLIPDELKQLLKQYNSPDEAPVVVCALDKLKIRLEACVKDALPGEQVRHLADDITLQLHNEIGTPLHRCLWQVYHGGQLVGMLESGGRSPNMARYDYLTLNNDIIWGRGWYQHTAAHVLSGLGAKFHSIANLDICIDGLPGVTNVFNQYIIQNMLSPSSGPRIVRAQKGSPKFGTNQFDDKLGAFEHYYIGKKGADKRFVIYEKNQEITYISPHKQYIRDTWDLNGIDADGPVWRCEIRLKGKTLDMFDIQDLEQLENPNYLMQIFRTATDGFVDFRVTDGETAINHCEKIDLLGFVRLGVEKLELIKKNLSVGLYKAKMAVHSAFQHSISGDFMQHEVKEAMAHCINLVNRFNLREWLIRTWPKWEERYKRRSDQDVTYLLQYV